MSHGQAAAVRGCVESETFDLAGQNVTTIEKTIRDAFNNPMDLSEMIRITFIVGAGKLGRARYDDNAAKAVTATLREVGFEEDRGASSVMDCAGSFKLQHDTGKNLKTVVVFPKVKSIGDATEVGKSSAADNNMPVFLEDSIHHKIAHASMSVFQKMIESQCITWSQKKECANVLNEIRHLAVSLENSLVSGKAISNVEQDFFDSVSITSIDEKLLYIRDCLQKHIDTSKVTNLEKQFVLNQVQRKLEELESNIDSASKDGKSKKVETMKEAQKVAMARMEKITKVSPLPLPKLKNDSAIRELRSELVPLLQLKDTSKGRLLTLKESQAVNKIEELEERIQELELNSRGWFESDEVFKSRVDASYNSWLSATRVKQSSNPKAAPTKSAKTSNWVTPTSTSTAPSKKPVTKTTGGSLFAAMMNDSDSD